MEKINVTDLRQHLPEVLKRVAKGELIQITVHGQVVARLVPELDQQANAQAKLEEWRKTVVLGDVESPLEEVWGADEENL
jgi:prevent-host-death family protein